MKTKQYARKPFTVTAVQVTAENMSEVAKWCQGTVIGVAGADDFIKVKVHRPLTKKQTEASVGDYVLWNGTGYKIYTEKAFDKSFTLRAEMTKKQADAAGIRPPREPRLVNKAKPQGASLVLEAKYESGEHPVEITKAGQLQVASVPAEWDIDLNHPMAVTKALQGLELTPEEEKIAKAYLEETSEKSS